MGIFSKVARFELQKWQRRKECIVVSASIQQEQSGFNVPSKPNLCLMYLNVSKFVLKKVA